MPTKSCSVRCASSPFSADSIRAISASSLLAAQVPHANALAELLGCYPVLVPPSPGVLSALGFLEAEFKNEFVQTFIRSTVGLDAGEVWSRFATLGEKAKAWLDEQEVEQGDRSIGYSLDLRYEQQGFEVTIEVPAALVAKSGPIDEILDRFHTTHQRLYGVRFHVPVELVALRVIATGATPNVEEALPEQGQADLPRRLWKTRPCYFGGAWVDTPNYDRANSPSGQKSPARRSSANTIRPPCCCRSTPPRSTVTAIF